MYWLMDYSPGNLALLGLVLLGYFLGGCLVARHAFRLDPSERLVAGMAVGVGLYMVFVNGLGQVLPVGVAYSAGSLTVLGVGVALAVRSGRRFLDAEDLQAWPQLVALAGLTVLITLIGRGLSILDDRKNLSLISLLAAGDLPPHFYMNPDWLIRYHYGFQLLAASLVRIGGLFPWSAFDLAKGLVGGLSIVLGYLAGKRLTHTAAGGWAAAVLLVFASGARWLLLLVPPAGLRQLSSLVTLWGSAGTTAAALDRALVSSWVISGGPPSPIPFAYVNGILEPFSIGIQAGPGSLSRILLILFFLLAGRLHGWRSFLPMSLLLAGWSLASEATYGVVLLGLGLSAAGAFALRRDSRFPLPTRVLLAAGGVSLGLSLVQGGTLTELARNALGGGSLAGAESGGPALFSIRWPLAIVSSHLGELRLDDWRLVLVALAELGAVVLVGPWVTRRAIHWLRQGRMERAILGTSALAGFLLPLFVRYETDRDISRFTAHALIVWSLLSLGGWAALWRRSARARPAIAAYGFVACFGGAVAFSSLLTAIPRGVISDEMAPLDAQMARQVWDQLEPGAVVLDSHSWRSVALTGRWARSTGADGEPLPAWRALVAAPDPTAIAAAGYSYVYLDTHWWRMMTPEARASFDAGCVKSVASGEDDADNGSRRLLDVRGCAPSGGPP